MVYPVDSDYRREEGGVDCTVHIVYSQGECSVVPHICVVGMWDAGIAC